MALSDFLTARRRAMLNAVGLSGERTAQVSGDVYAPKGVSFPGTNSLAGQIKALTPRRIGRFAECTVVSRARSRSGFDYAKYQHDRVLRHVSFMPRSLSFVDFGQSGTRAQKYPQGYRAAAAGSPRYKSEYLVKGAAATRMDHVNIIRAALV
jgi:hypothetical protein